MSAGRKWVFLWVGLGAVLACAWCSLLSGIGGWVLGSDIGAREERARLEAEAMAGPDLPPLGVLVTRLERDGPAARAGIQRSDVIVAVNGEQVQDARDLRDLLLSYQSGDTLDLTVLRERGQRAIPVRLGAFPGDARRPYLGIYYTSRADEPADI